MRILNLFRRYPISRIISRGYCSASNEPVKFTTSKAHSWKAEYSRRGEAGSDESAWFQPYVVVVSVGVILLYFCVLREENDIDEMLGAPIFDKVEGLEEVSLRRALEYNLDHGIDSSKIITRLKELEAKKKNTGSV